MKFFEINYEQFMNAPVLKYQTIINIRSYFSEWEGRL